MKQAGSPPPIGELYSASEGMREILAQLQELAPSLLPVVLLGETGVGKTWLARALHEEFGVKGPFVRVACPSISEPLFESELFGHLSERVRRGRRLRQMLGPQRTWSRHTIDHVARGS